MGHAMPVHTDTGEDLFRLAELDRDALQQITSDAVGGPVRIVDVRIQSFPYDWGSIPTAGLWRVAVEYVSDTHGEGEYSFFVKLLRNTRLSPQVRMIPQPHRDEFVAYLPWKFEYDMAQSGIAGVLPDGMRMPVLHQAKFLDDDYLGIWWEFVEVDPMPWTTPDFARTAYLLGQLAARRQSGATVNDRLPAACHDVSLGSALRYYTISRVIRMELPVVSDPGFWQSELMARAVADIGDVELRGDMLALGERVPAILDRLDQLPQTFAHGDASPQNLLIPAADRAQRIVIDWGFGTLLPIGFDLGQLLVGLAHAGEVDPDELDAIRDAIVPAYLEGLADEGYQADPADVQYGFIGSLVTRSALCSLPSELVGQPISAANLALMKNRLRLTRVLVDMAQSLE